MDELKRKEYLALLEKIAELEKKRLKSRKEANKLRDRMHTISSMITVEICLATDEKGKVLYSNEKVREAAIHLKLTEHKEYCELREKLGPFLEDEFHIEHNKLTDQKELLMVELGFPPQVKSDEVTVPQIY